MAARVVANELRNNGIVIVCGAEGGKNRATSDGPEGSPKSLLVLIKAKMRLIMNIMVI